jgi:Cyclin-dependent kinase regulatory subunit
MYLYLNDALLKLVKYLPVDRLAKEEEWRDIGIRQRLVRALPCPGWSCERTHRPQHSPGWVHYMLHARTSRLSALLTIILTLAPLPAEVRVDAFLI